LAAPPADVEEDDVALMLLLLIMGVSSLAVLRELSIIDYLSIGNNIILSRYLLVLLIVEGL
jgi:hypothetical protein